MKAARAAKKKQVDAARRGPGRPRKEEAPPDDRPSFLNDAPQPEARFTEAKPAADPDKRAAAVNELVMTYAGAHYTAAWAFSIEQLQVSEQEAREVCGRFITMMEAWGVAVDDFAGGRIMATFNFASLFLMVELGKLNLFTAAIAERRAEAQRQADAAEAQRQEEARQQPMGPAPEAMTGQPYDLAAE